MTRDIIPEETVIQTGSTGILAICDCDEQRHRDELCATTGESGHRDVVLVRRDGTVTNRYADGVTGVTSLDREIAKTDDELYCPDCENYIRGWIRTEE